MRIEFCWHIFEKKSQLLNFIKIRQVVAELFRNFANAPKKSSKHCAIRNGYTIVAFVFINRIQWFSTYKHG